MDELVIQQLRLPVLSVVRRIEVVDRHEVVPQAIEMLLPKEVQETEEDGDEAADQSRLEGDSMQQVALVVRWMLHLRS